MILPPNAAAEAAIIPPVVLHPNTAIVRAIVFVRYTSCSLGLREKANPTARDAVEDYVDPVVLENASYSNTQMKCRRHALEVIASVATRLVLR